MSIEMAADFGLLTGKKFNIPVQVQPQVFAALSLVSWSQILIYNQYECSRQITACVVTNQVQSMEALESSATQCKYRCSFWGRRSASHPYS